MSLAARGMGLSCVSSDPLPSPSCQVWDVTMQDLCSGAVKLDPFRGLAFVGGFSYADVLGSAKGQWQALPAPFPRSRGSPLPRLGLGLPPPQGRGEGTHSGPDAALT